MTVKFSSIWTYLLGWIIGDFINDMLPSWATVATPLHDRLYSYFSIAFFIVAVWLMEKIVGSSLTSAYRKDE